MARPLKVVLSCKQSPLNPVLWCLYLTCNHVVWIRSKGRPVRKLQTCAECELHKGEQHVRMG